MRYDVMVVGFRLNASLKPAQVLQRVLGLDAETSKELTRRFPASVLTGVSLSQAQRVSQELSDAGAKVEVRESRVALASEAAGGAAAPLLAKPLETARRAASAERTEDTSGNYEIGEILAPLERGPAASPAPAPAAPTATPVTKQASREELDEALHGSAQPDQPASAAPAAPSKAPAAKPAVTDSTVAFAGMQNFGGGLDGFDEVNTPQLQVDEEAMRSIQRAREPAPEVAKTPAAAALPARIGDWSSRFGAALLEWGTALLSLLAVAGITLLAVGYALDPDHLLRPIGLENFPDGAKKALADLFGN